MKTTLRTLSVLSVLSFFLLSGCAYYTPPMASITNVVYPGIPAVVSPTGEIGSKTGESSTFTLFILFSTGDAGIVAAARNGDITHIKTIDHRHFSFFGIVERYYTIVTGD